MLFKQYYLGCLAHASYLVGDGGDAAVIDPQRDVDAYLDDARAAGLTIRHVIETHLHADFVSGHIELARRAGARIYIGHRAGAEFEHVPVHDEMELSLGALTLRFIETPGHTPEGISILVVAQGRPARLLTGDTLFIGDVGRPDLAGGKGFTAAQMAGMLYDTLQTKILPLPDDVEVYPAHGAGSSCGRFMSSERSSTIGAQKRTKYALQPMARERFVELISVGLPPPPPYFAHDAELNRRGAPPLSELPRPRALSPAEVDARVAEGAVVLDVRDPESFGRGHVPGAINIGLDGSFASWAGSLIPLGTPIVLVAADDGKVAEATTRLARVGHEAVAGVLDGAVAAWARDGRTVAVLAQVSVDELARRLQSGAPLSLVDVRRPGEHDAGHLAGAVNLPLDGFPAKAAALPADRPTYVICASGYRSSTAASLLLGRGHPGDVVNVPAGHAGWAAAGRPLQSKTA